MASLNKFFNMINDSLNIVLLNINDHTFTIGNILMVPLWLVLSMLITKLVVNKIGRELKLRKKGSISLNIPRLKKQVSPTY